MCLAPNEFLVRRLGFYVDCYERLLEGRPIEGLDSGDDAYASLQQAFCSARSSSELRSLLEGGVGTWPLPAGVGERFRRGQATDGDCQAVERLMNAMEALGIAGGRADRAAAAADSPCSPAISLGCGSLGSGGRGGSSHSGGGGSIRGPHECYNVLQDYREMVELFPG